MVEDSGKESLSTLAMAIDAVATGVMLIDPSFHIVFVNSAYRKMFSFDGAVCCSGCNYRDLVAALLQRGEYGNENSAADAVECRLAPVRDRVSVSRARVRPDGRVVSIQGVPLDDGNYVYTYTDITAEHSAAERAKEAYKATVVALADLAEYRDSDTGDHVIRVSRLTYEIAREMRSRGTLLVNDPDQFCSYVATASVLHDVGKVAISDAILHKPGLLDLHERLNMQKHSAVGAAVLAKAVSMAPDSRYLRMGVDIAHYHHERYDGTGYPEKLAGAAIPLAARIVAAADVFDALTSTRPYKQAWPEAEAVEFVAEQAGKHFDPDVVAAFLTVMEERSKTPLMQWDQSMSVGHPLLDRDHKVLMALINQMALENNRNDRVVLEYVLDELLGYAAAHFAREEEYMAEIGFTGLAAHRKLHQRLTGEVQAIRVKFLRGTHALGDEIRDFLALWLRRHILNEDKKYVAAARLTGNNGDRDG